MVKPQCDHPIYSGHFPDNPITPGVCLVQLAKELASHCWKLPLEIKGIKMVKFLNMLVPDENVTATCLLRYDSLTGTLQAEIRNSEMVYAKMTLLLK